jgi:FAD dependent oxidoreductase
MDATPSDLSSSRWYPPTSVDSMSSMNTTKLSVPFNQLLASELALKNYKTDAYDENSPSSNLPVPNPTKPYWLDPDANPLAKHGSDGDLSISDADICIIGSGITGVSAAYHLSKSLCPPSSVDLTMGKTKIAILEARDFCSHSPSSFNVTDD